MNSSYFQVFKKTNSIKYEIQLIKISKKWKNIVKHEVQKKYKLNKKKKNSRAVDFNFL